MSHLDVFQIVPSLIVALFAAAFLAVWRYDGRLTSAALFAASYCAGAAGMAVDYFNMVVMAAAGDLGTGLISNGLYTTTMVLFAAGMLHLYGGLPRRRWLAGAALAVMGGYLVLYFHADTTMRTWWMNVSATVVFGAPVLLRWRHASPGLDRLVFVLVGLTALQYSARTAIVLSVDPGLTAENYYVSLAATSMRFPSAITSLCVATALLIAFTARIVRRLSEASQTDPLTGLLNRRGLDATLGRRGGAVVVANIDHFKAVNDKHGHAAGDAVLVAFARAIGQASGAGLTARIGGEEFVVVLPGATPALARLAAEGMRTVVAATPQLALGGARVTASFGVAGWGTDEPFDHAFARADAALYEAKRGGRDRTVIAADPVRTARAA